MAAFFDIEKDAVVRSVSPSGSVSIDSPSPPPVRASPVSVADERRGTPVQQDTCITSQPEHRVKRSDESRRQKKQLRVKSKVSNDSGAYRRKRSSQAPLHLNDHPLLFPQSYSGGWANDSDSDCSDVFSEVNKIEISTVKQIYIVVTVVAIVVVSVASIFIFEWIFGKPKIHDNTFDFLKDDDDKNEL